MNAFFWDESKFSKLEKDETCYLNMCDPHPCHPHSGCINTWDGQKAGYECEFGQFNSNQVY